MPERSTCAWVRYGAMAIRDEEIDLAARRCSAAIIQPWETAAAARLKRLRPDMVVLAYQCLSSTRSYEPGPVYSSGVSHGEAPDAWFARRATGERIEWRGYPGHWQMAVWEDAYQDRWCDRVVARFEGTAFDGVMADNDVYDDYYGILPLAGGRGMADVRAALGRLVAQAGERLNATGLALVPNIAESRREAGRWSRHAAWGGGFEEVFLSWAPDGHLGRDDVRAQADAVSGPGVAIARCASDGTDADPMLRYAVAAFWVLGGGTGTGVTATAHDGYDGMPWVHEQAVDLGTPTGPVREVGGVLVREFSAGFAAAAVEAGEIELPVGARTLDGRLAPRRLALPARTGILLRMPVRADGAHQVR